MIISLDEGKAFGKIQHLFMKISQQTKYKENPYELTKKKKRKQNWNYKTIRAKFQNTRLTYKIQLISSIQQQ